MILQPEAVRLMLFLPPDAPVEIEAGGMYPSLEDRVTVVADGEQRTVVVRSNMDGELAHNHAAILDMLTQTRFPPVPRVYAIQGGVTIEEEVPAVSALALQLPPASIEAAIDALALLHGVQTREGLRQEDPPESVIEADLQLFRLGYTFDERTAAAPHLAKARELLLQGAPFGFVHGDCTADKILAAASRAWLVDFAHGGFGCQLFDVAAFLMTAGEPPERREQLAERYSRTRRLPEGSAGLVELAELLWGLNWLMGLSRRLVLAYEDDIVSAQLSLIASRIDRATREGWSGHAHPVAADIRSALWPNRRAKE